MTLTFQVNNGKGEGIPNILVWGSWNGGQSFNGFTDDTGFVQFKTVAMAPVSITASYHVNSAQIFNLPAVNGKALIVGNTRAVKNIYVVLKPNTSSGSSSSSGYGNVTVNFKVLSGYTPLDKASVKGKFTFINTVVPFNLLTDTSGIATKKITVQPDTTVSVSYIASLGGYNSSSGNTSFYVNSSRFATSIPIYLSEKSSGSSTNLTTSASIHGVSTTSISGSTSSTSSSSVSSVFGDMGNALGSNLEIILMASALIIIALVTILAVKKKESE